MFHTYVQMAEILVSSYRLGGDIWTETLPYKQSNCSVRSSPE